MSFINLIKKKIKYDKHLDLTEKEVKKLQRNKLNNLLKFSYKNSDFYREKFQGLGLNYGDLEEVDLKDLPTTDKNKLMNNFNQVVTDKDLRKEDIINFVDEHPDPAAVYKNKYYIIHSSGTTGEIGYYVYDQDNWELLKAVGASRLFRSFGLKRKKYAFIGASDGHYAGISFFLSPVNRLEELFYRDFLVLDINYPLDSYIEKLNKLKPDVISGYPSAMSMLLDYQEKGSLNIKPETIICGGEPLTKEAYNKIVNNWQQEPINYYGTSESIMMGAGIGRDGLYIFDDLIILEIKEDKVLLTNLYNYTEPLIRYEMDDLIIKGSKKDKKWPFTFIENISGREEEMLWMENETGSKDFIHPIVFAEFHVKGLKKFQIIKTSDIALTFKAVKADEYKKEDLKKNIEKRLYEILEKKQMKNLNITIQFVKDIENDPQTGKFKLIKKS